MTCPCALVFFVYCALAYGQDQQCITSGILANPSLTTCGTQYIGLDPVNPDPAAISSFCALSCSSDFLQLLETCGTSSAFTSICESSGPSDGSVTVTDSTTTNSVSTFPITSDGSVTVTESATTTNSVSITFPIPSDEQIACLTTASLSDPEVGVCSATILSNPSGVCELDCLPAFIQAAIGCGLSRDDYPINELCGLVSTSESTTDTNDVTTSGPDNNGAIHTVAVTMMVVVGVIAALFFK